ncbi:MAG: SpoVG family protein [Lachnospiraceae bacterium]|nr:SpoVG family protein [Lachnospiraceae bacterium]
MEVTDIKMTVLNNNTATKAISSISLDSELAIRGVRVMESRDGRNFISFPSRERADGQYDDIAFPLTKELYHKVADAVIAEYNTQKEKASLEQEKAKDAFMDVAAMADANPDQVFMDAPAPAKEAKTEEAPKPRKGRGR